MKVLADIIIDIISGLFDFLLEGIQGLERGRHDHTLNSSFGRKRSLLSSKHHGFSIGVGNNLSTLQSHNHVMVCAPSGVGKTSCVIFPSIINIATSPEGASMVIGDPKREFTPIEPFLIHCGYTVIPFDILHPENSIRFNSYARANTASEINKVSDLLVHKNGERKDNDYWTQQSIGTVNTFAKYLKANASIEFQNIANIYYLLEEMAGDEDTISNMFIAESDANLWRSYKALVANSPRTKASIISSAIASLSFVGLNPNLCDLTSTDTFDFSRLKSEKIALFLRCPLQDQNLYASLFGIFYSQLFDYLYDSIPAETDRKLFVLIDELANIPLPNLASVMSTARSYFAIMGVIQSENQLYEKYGTHNGKTILNNCTRVYMTGLDDECERIEKSLGAYTFFEDKEKKVSRTRPLMTAQEIRTMPRDHVLVIPNGGMKPILLKNVKPWYKVPRCVDYMNMESDEEPLQRNTRTEVQYLPLDQYRSTNQPTVSENNRDDE